MKVPINIFGGIGIDDGKATSTVCTNLHPRVLTDRSDQPTTVLERFPGLTSTITIGTVGATKCRGGALLSNGDGIFVVDSEAFRIHYSGATLIATLIGTVAGSGAVYIADNGFHVVISAAANAYLVNMTTFAISALADPDFPVGGQVVFLDGYIIANKPNTQAFYRSDVYDATAWAALDFSSAEAFPDTITGIAAFNGYLIALGQQTIQAFYNTGNSTNPWQPVNGSVAQVGCRVQRSIVSTPQGVFFVGQPRTGQAGVYLYDASKAERMSNPGVDAYLDMWSRTSLAFATSMEIAGDPLYLLTVPDEAITLVLSQASSTWFDLRSWDNVNSHWTAYGAVCAIGIDDTVLVGTNYSPNVWKTDRASFKYSISDEKNKIVRTFRAGTTGGVRVRYNWLQVDINAGIGSSDSTMGLRVNHDGGSSSGWSTIVTQVSGSSAREDLFVKWPRLGSGRNTVFEISSNSDQAYVIHAAIVDGVQFGY